MNRYWIVITQYVDFEGYPVGSAEVHRRLFTDIDSASEQAHALTQDKRMANVVEVVVVDEDAAHD